VKIGEILKGMPKAQGQRSDLQLIRTSADKLNNQKKSDAIKSLGFNQTQVERFQKLSSSAATKLEETKTKYDAISKKVAKSAPRPILPLMTRKSIRTRSNRKKFTFMAKIRGTNFDKTRTKERTVKY
jgi:hypothetical protein